MRFGSGMHPELLRLKPPSQVSLATGLVRTFHFVLGSLVFATAVVMALLAHQRPARAVSYRAVPADALEGAA